ncbi:hypothetical protein [Ornithinibacillus scapharcae]|uniref:SF0329 family protein n=1 Tax=Ornithinibacillus scapharcae TaxID=1147159 RepID=UPI000225AAD0|nr:hypothetical protein [Ornithinibacillus scapharcae]
MQWSKTKTTLESFLCDRLKGRVRIHATVYRKFHDGPSKVWITFDKREIVSATDVTFAIEHEKLYQQLKEENGLKPIPYHPDWNVMFQSEEREQLVRASDTADETLIGKGIFDSNYLYTACMEYPSLSIEDAMNSEHIMIRAYSMFDRRLGKRRLKEIPLSDDIHPLIVEFYNIRCDVEGLSYDRSGTLE